MRARFHCSCVNWPQHDVDKPGGLCDMIASGRDITRLTFCRRVHPEDRREVERALGYDRDFPISKDFAVRFMSGLLHGRRVWWIKHSAIEYVFTITNSQPKTP